MSKNLQSLRSVCVFCGSSEDADPQLLADAGQFGRLLADARIRLVYGGGGVGLMGACARGAHGAGGEVLGIIPAFLTGRELPLDGVETVVVETMHERKIMMFNQSDAFVVLPGGIGTLEEVVELLSWRRLELHRKPVVFYSPDNFWAPLTDLFDHTIQAHLTPESFRTCYSVVTRCEDILPALEA